MKKAMFYVTSAAMAAAMAIPAPVAAQGNSAFNKFIVEFCSSFSNGQTGETGLPNQGGCVSSFKAAGPVGFCKSLKDFDLLWLGGWRNQGECVVELS